MPQLYLLLCFIAAAAVLASPWYAVSEGSIDTFEPTTGKRVTIASFELSPGPSNDGETLIAPAQSLGKNGTIFFVQSDKFTGKSYPCSVDLVTKRFVQGPTLDFTLSLLIFDDDQQRLFALNSDSSTILEFSLLKLSVNQTTSGFQKYGFALGGVWISKSVITYEVSLGDDNRLVAVDVHGLSPAFLDSSKFDYNVFGLLHDVATEEVFGIWSYNIATPIVVMRYDTTSWKSELNVTLSPDKFHGQDGFLPFALRGSTSEILAVIGGSEQQYGCVLSYKTKLMLEQCSQLPKSGGFFEDNLFAF